MIDEELARLKNRIDDLRNRIIPNLDSKAQQVYAQVMSMPKESEKRLKLRAGSISKPHACEYRKLNRIWTTLKSAHPLMP